MPLNVRSNGSTSSNIITASWFNDIRDLLTGTMQDQEVTVKNNLALNAIGANPSTALTATLAAGTTMGIGLYVYTYTYVSPDGESAGAPTTSITTTTGNRSVSLSNISVGPTGTTARKIYRTAVGGGIYYNLVTTINDNTTTTYTDTLADASLGASIPFNSTLGGSLVIKDSSGTNRLQIANDGTYISNVALTRFTGTVSGSATMILPFWGTQIKIGYIQFVTYNSANNILFQFPIGSRLARGIYIVGNFGSATPTIQFQLNGAVQSSYVMTALASGGGTANSQTTVHQNSIGTIPVSIDQIQISSTSGQTYESGIVFIGI